MPPPEMSNRLQKALLWEKVGIDSYGEPVISPTPIEINVRWLDKKREVVGPNGEPIAVDGSIITYQRVTIGSIMWLGSLSEWLGTGSSDTSATENKPQLMQTVTYNETPDLKNRLAMHELNVMYFRGTLPTVST